MLFSTPDEIFERVSSNDKRPLLNVDNPRERIANLLRKRTPYYMRSGVAIAADRNMKITEDRIMRIYAAQKRRLKKSKLR